MRNSDCDSRTEREKNLCFGCLTYETKIVETGEVILCEHKPVKGILICPCCDCLIKSMCEDECARFYFFRQCGGIEFYNDPYDITGVKQ